MHKKRWARVALCVLAMLGAAKLAASPLVAQTEPAQTLSISTIPASPAPTETPSASEPSAQAQMWNLKNADIRAVIQTISILTGKNFIIDPRVQGNVTLISQKPMTPDELYQVFLSMLQILQFAAVPTGNVIKIVPAMDASTLSRQIATNANPGSGDEIVVRVVAVNHVSAPELVPVLRPLMSQSGSITAYMPSNALILAGSASNINRLVKVIHNMDVINSSQVTVVRMHYANAKHVVSVIRTLQSANQARGGVSNVALANDDDDNSILISANDTNTAMIENLIRTLDRKGTGADDTRVIRLNYLSAKKLAPIIAKIAAGISATDAKATGKAGATASDADDSKSNVSIQAEDSDNAIIMHAPVGILNNLTTVIQRLDTRPREVLVEAIIVKVDENLLNKLGIVWGTANNNANNASTTVSGNIPTDGVAQGAAVTSTGAAVPASSVIGSHNTLAMQIDGGVGFLPGQDLTMVLHLLKQNGSSDVLSTPSVVVLDNEKAVISDGQNVGMANRSYQGASATTTGNPAQNEVTPFNTIQRTDVALSLQVTPQISPNQMIRMVLKQKDDAIAPDANAGSDNPTINTSQIDTAVMVKSGSILVLGGLISNEQEKTQQKLPILGDIPILGRLFRYNTHTIEKENLMVFIRPIIMQGNMGREQTKHRYAFMRQAQIQSATDHVTQKDIPLLPNLTSQKPLPLPSPVKTMDLPTPTETDK